MNARSLDAAIARHLLGYEVEPRHNARTGELDYVCRRAGQEWQRVSFYSSANAIMALAVEFKLSDLGWKLTPASEARGNATGHVRVLLEREGAQVDGTAGSCRMATLDVVTGVGTTPDLSFPRDFWRGLGLRRTNVGRAP